MEGKEQIIKILNEFAEPTTISGVSFPVNTIDEGSFEKLAEKLSQLVEEKQKEVFEAARELRHIQLQRLDEHKYPTFEDYLNFKNKEK